MKTLGKVRKRTRIVGIIKDSMESHSIGIHVGLPTKIRLLKSLLWLVVSYGCESWMLK